MPAPEEITAVTLRRVDVAPGSAPHLHPEIQPFWDSLQRGHLSVQRCADCATLRFPLSPNCHECLSGNYTWEPIDPRGVVNVAIEVHRAAAEMVTSGMSPLPPWRDIAPYNTGVVDMDAGVRLPGRIQCECGAALQPGTEVVAALMDTVKGLPVYGFAHDCKGSSDK